MRLNWRCYDESDISRLESTDKRWIDENIKKVTSGIPEILKDIKQSE